MFPRSQCLLNCGCIATYLTEKGYPSYSPLNTSWMSLVFFAAFVDPSGLPGPFLRFSGGPAGGLFVRRLLLLTCVQFCSFSAWAGAGWVGAGAGTGTSPGARTGTETGTGTGAWPGTENRTGLSLYACFAIVVRLTRTGQFLSQDWWAPRQFTHLYFDWSSFPRQSLATCPGAAQHPHRCRFWHTLATCPYW